MRIDGPVRVAVLAVTLLACGDDAKSAPSPARACETVCNKLDACDTLGDSGLGACTQGCGRADSAAGSGGAGACQVGSAQANACIAAIDEASCSELRAGEFPAACAACDAGAGGAQGGAGSGGAAGGGAVGCPELGACCGAIPAAEQQSLCNMVVRMNNASLCAAVLPGYRSAGQCP